MAQHGDLSDLSLDDLVKGGYDANSPRSQWVEHELKKRELKLIAENIDVQLELARSQSAAAEAQTDAAEGIRRQAKYLLISVILVAAFSAADLAVSALDYSRPITVVVSEGSSTEPAP